MSDYFDQEDGFDYEQELLSLVADFAKKVQNNEPSVFYDLDDWLDIIDYFIAEDPDNALLGVALDKAEATYPHSVEITVRRAEYLSQFDLNAAYELLNEERTRNCYRSEEDGSLIYYQFAKVLIRMKRYADAEICLLRSKELNNEFFFEQMAEIAVRRKRFDEAEQSVLRALDRDKDRLMEDDVSAYGAGDFLFLNTVLSDNLLTLAATVCRRRKESVEKLTEAMEYFVRENPFSCDYWEALAEFHMRAKNYEGAEQAYGYALSLAPDDLDIKRKMLQIHMSRLDKRKTCLAIDKLIIDIEKEQERVKEKRLQNNLHELWKACMREYLESSIYLQWYDKCFAMCEKVLEKNKSVPICDGLTFYSKGEIRMFMARCLVFTGETDKGLRLAMKVMQDEPEYYGHRISFAELLCDCGDMQQAEEIYQSIYEQCSEQAAKTQFNDDDERETAIFFRKHKCYVAASWAVKMAQNGRVEQASTLMEELFSNMDKEAESEMFVIECSLIEILQCVEDSRDKINEILEDMILERDYTAEAIVHRIPSLTEDKEYVLKLKELTEKAEEND